MAGAATAKVGDVTLEPGKSRARLGVVETTNLKA
jgi:hypothetical protein